MYRVGFSTIGTPQYDIDQVIEIAKANGYEGVELRLIRGVVDLPTLEEFSPTGIEKTARKFAAAGITVNCVDTGVHMANADPEVRKAEFAAARAHCDIALALGSPLIRVFGGERPENQSEEETTQAIAEGLTIVADETASRGVTSIIEMHDVFSTSESILDLYRRGASENLGVLWDTFHTYRAGESAQYTWDQLGPRIKHVHIKDGIESPSTTRGYEYRLSGVGTIPMGSFLDTLAASDYDGWVNYEWEKAWHPTIEEPEVALPHFAQWLRQRQESA